MKFQVILAFKKLVQVYIAEKKMVVFKQSRKLWFQCGLHVEDFPSIKMNILNKLYKIIIFGSQFSFLIGSFIFTWKFVQYLELFQMVYIALQNQWAILSVSLIVCINLVEKRIRNMLTACQNIVDKSNLI